MHKLTMTKSCLPSNTLLEKRSTLWIAACLLSFSGCGQSAENANPDPVQQQPSTATKLASNKSESAGGLSGKIKFKTASGETAFSIKSKDDGAKLVDGDEKELARFNHGDFKLKVKAPEEKVLGYVIVSDGNFKIKNADQSVELWKFQSQQDGDWKLEDGNNKLFYKIKKRDYGYEIEDDAGSSLYKVKLKDGKTSLRNSSDETVYSTKDQIPTLALTCLGFDEIDSLQLKSGLMTMLIIESGRE